MEGPQSHLHRDISRGRRRRLTTSLLRQVAETDEARKPALLDEIVLVNLCVARSLAARYASRGVAREDLEQVASAALVRAVHHFDPVGGHDLLSYAVPSIRGELRRHFRDQGWVVRPPRRIQELQPQVIAERDRLGQADPHAGAPTTTELARRLEVPEADVAETLALEGCFSPASLDVPVGRDGDVSLGDLLADGSGARESDAAEARVMLGSIMRALPARDRTLLRMRFFDDLTQREIAEKIGVTQTQVSRRLGRVLTALRKAIGEVTSRPIAGAAGLRAAAG
ncbi:MAG: sigma-70 family RNA polymerase sigma factor [Nocardioidaceae bacterium]|nr:sigma-70 family RNA polymerase sigma factor [Nocardioidaceae bacterium]